jgi:hypothetical protein
MKVTVFWDVASRSLVETDRRFVLTASTINIALMMQAVSSCKTSVNFCEAARRNILQDSHLQGSSCLPSVTTEFSQL